MGLNCSLNVNEPIMNSTLSCDKGGFNGVERFPRVNFKCPNNAMKTPLVYLLITTQPCFSKAVSATQDVNVPAEEAHTDVFCNLKMRTCGSMSQPKGSPCGSGLCGWTAIAKYNLQI